MYDQTVTLVVPVCEAMSQAVEKDCCMVIRGTKFGK
jgi:hypothetical protein